jgi:hypothetical protein
LTQEKQMSTPDFEDGFDFNEFKKEALVKHCCPVV